MTIDWGNLNDWAQNAPEQCTFEALPFFNVIWAIKILNSSKSIFCRQCVFVVFAPPARSPHLCLDWVAQPFIAFGSTFQLSPCFFLQKKTFILLFKTIYVRCRYLLNFSPYIEKGPIYNRWGVVPIFPSQESQRPCWEGKFFTWLFRLSGENFCIYY